MNRRVDKDANVAEDEQVDDSLKDGEKDEAGDANLQLFCFQVEHVKSLSRHASIDIALKIGQLAHFNALQSNGSEHFVEHSHDEDGVQQEF